MMQEILQVNPAYKIELCNDGILLLSEKRNSYIQGNLENLIFKKLIEKNVSKQEIVENLKDDFSLIEILKVIKELSVQNLIIEECNTLPETDLSFWALQGFDLKKLTKILNEQSLSIRSLIDLPDYQYHFNKSGIKLCEGSDLELVLTDSYYRKELSEINREHFNSKKSWIPLKMSGQEIWLGPIFNYQGACFECLNQRLLLNYTVYNFYNQQSKTDDFPKLPLAYTPFFISIAMNLAIQEIVKWFYQQDNHPLNNKLMTLNSQTMKIEYHEVIKRPQCPVCGNPTKKKPKKIILKNNSLVNQAVLGGYREVRPEITLSNYQKHISSITGIVQTLEPYNPIKNAPIFNYLSGNNVAIRSQSLFWLNNHNRSANGGKGKNPLQAKVGALCEAIERYSLCYHGEEFAIKASLNDLGGDGIHPNLCMNYSKKQFENRDKLNEECNQFYSMIPIEFDCNEKMDWTPVYSLKEKKFKYLPSCFCYAQYPAEDEKHLYAYPDSNGTAAGNTLEEAILQGILELIERDSVAIWWYNKIERPSVDIKSFNDRYYHELIDYYRSINRNLYILDLTTDLNVPCFGAFSYNFNSQKQNILFGFGAHVDAKIALDRAIVELNQLLPIAVSSKSEPHKSVYLTQDKNFIDWLELATIDKEKYCQPSNHKEKTVHDYDKLMDPSILNAIEYCLDRLYKSNLDVLVLDLTRQDIKLPVVKVFSPGLRHFWKRLAPGRLYDVPVKMGWFSEAKIEEDMNPIGLFI